MPRWTPPLCAFWLFAPTPESGYICRISARSSGVLAATSYALQGRARRNVLFIRIRDFSTARHAPPKTYGKGLSAKHAAKAVYPPVCTGFCTLTRHGSRVQVHITRV